MCHLFLFAIACFLVVISLAFWYNNLCMRGSMQKSDSNGEYSMNSELKAIIADDLLRYGKKRAGMNAPLYLRYQVVYRKAAFFPKKSIRGMWYRIRLRRLSERSGIQIPTSAKLGRGLFIGHNGRIIINPEVVTGNNLNIATGVTIGKTNRGSKAGTPTIGNDVWIGAGAVIVGKINIGDDVMIAPNAYVNIDIPSHSIVVGNPAVVHSRENATQGYINNRV